MAKKQNRVKEEIKVKCFFKDTGEDFNQIIKTSFLLFLKSAGELTEQSVNH